MTPEAKYNVVRATCFAAALLCAGVVLAIVNGWVTTFMGAALPVMTKLRERPDPNAGVMPVYAVPEQK